MEARKKRRCRYRMAFGMDKFLCGGEFYSSEKIHATLYIK